MTSLEVSREGRWLVVRLARPHRTLSWAIVGGGLSTTTAVGWLAVRTGELAPPVDAAEHLEAALAAQGLAGAVGLLTSADLDDYALGSRSADAVTCEVVATVGLGNTVFVGAPADGSAVPETINILAVLSSPLTDGGLTEAVSIVTEARTAAMLEAGFGATGTGTDCVVVACPTEGRATPYAGKHTAIGHVIGAATLEAMRQGIASWRARTA